MVDQRYLLQSGMAATEIARGVCLLVRALDSRPGNPGSNVSSAIRASSNILGQDVYSVVLMSNWHFIRPGSINWNQPRLGVNFLCVTAWTAYGCASCN
jgi:hypothetical protein